MGSHCWGWAVRVQNGAPAPQHSQPLPGLCPGMQQLPCAPRPGQGVVQDSARATSASQCCHPSKPNIPAWAWRTLGIDKRGKGLLAVLCGGDRWVLGWVLWCLHGQSGPGLLSACRQLRETWLSHKTCWKRKLSSITALVRRLHRAGHDPGSGADQEGRIWIRPGRRC